MPDNTRRFGEYLLKNSTERMGRLLLRVESEVVPTELYRRDALHSRVTKVLEFLGGCSPVEVARAFREKDLPADLQNIRDFEQEIADACDPYLRLGELEEGCLYCLEARGSSAGIWVSEQRGFELARTELWKDSIEVEFHYDTGPPFGTAKPYQVIEVAPSFPSDEEKLVYLVLWRGRIYQQQDAELREGLQHEGEE